MPPPPLTTTCSLAPQALLKHSPIPEVLHRLEGMPREAGQLADKVVEAGAGVVEKVEEEAARAAQVRMSALPDFYRNRFYRNRFYRLYCACDSDTC